MIPGAHKPSGIFTYFTALVPRRTGRASGLIGKVLPLWEAGLDTFAIKTRLNEEYGLALHQSAIANAIAAWRDQQAGA